MAINPLSDLVLDVAHGVRGQDYHSSVEKLQRAKTVGEASQFTTDAGNLALKNQFDTVSRSLGINDMRPPVRMQESVALENPHRKFEAFMLQSFITDMFTSDTSSVFGKGTGGDIWKSMMAQMMADEIAQRGGIGVAALLDKQAEPGQIHMDADRDEAMAQATATAIVGKNQIELVRQIGKNK